MTECSLKLCGDGVAQMLTREACRLSSPRSIGPGPLARPGSMAWVHQHGGWAPDGVHRLKEDSVPSRGRCSDTEAFLSCIFVIF